MIWLSMALSLASCEPDRERRVERVESLTTDLESALQAEEALRGHFAEIRSTLAGLTTDRIAEIEGRLDPRRQQELRRKDLSTEIASALIELNDVLAQHDAAFAKTDRIVQEWTGLCQDGDGALPDECSKAERWLAQRTKIRFTCCK